MEDDGQMPSMEQEIETLEQAARTPAKLRSVKISTTVDSICQNAYEQGLTARHLQAIVDIITVKAYLDQSSTTQLIKNLYPAERVSSEIAIQVVGALGEGQEKPSPPTQAALVKWLGLIYDVLEDGTILSRLYGVLFGLLDMVSLRAPLCHLLALITRRKHVRPFRIQQLLELCRIAAHEPALLALLRVYKDYYPDIILGNISAGRSRLPTADLEWRQRLSALQDANTRTLEHGSYSDSGFRVARRGTKRTKIAVLPEVHTLHASETSVTLEEIDSVEDFVDKLDRIELPSQMISAFEDGLLRRYLVLNPTEDSSRRVGLWLSAYAVEELDSSENALPSSSSSVSHVLRGIIRFAQSNKSLLPAMMAFLKAYLPQWDGSSNGDAVFGSLLYLPQRHFQELHASYYSIAENAVAATDPAALDRLLTFYSDLVRRWLVSLIEQLSTAADLSLEFQWQRLSGIFDHVGTLAVNALSNSPPRGHAAILDFYEATSSCILSSIKKGIFGFPVIIPPAQVIYHFSLGPSLSDFSRISAILATYKQAFEAGIKSSHKYPPELTNHFNGYLMDICNLVWRSRAFVTSDPNARGCLCPEPVILSLQSYITEVDPSYSFSSIFGLSHSQLTSALSLGALRELEEQDGSAAAAHRTRHYGPATQKSLGTLERDGGLEVSWKQFRVEVLMWLERRGVAGVKELMFTTMKDLIKSST